MSPDPAARAPALRSPALLSLWLCTATLHRAETRRSIARALEGEVGPDAEGLAALVGAVEAQPGAVAALCAAVPLLSGTLGGPPAPWPLLVERGLGRLAPTDQEAVVAALLPRLRAEVDAATRAWGARPASVDLARIRAVVEASVPAVARAGAEAMAAVGQSPEVQIRQDAEARRIQAAIDTFNRLQADFADGRPQGPDAEGRAAALLAVEAALNAHWLACPRAAWGALADQGRFLSGGSGGVLAWLRNQGRHAEAVAHLARELRQVELCALRQRAHPRAFEALYNTGMGSVLDSGDPDDIELGMALHDGLMAVLRPFSGPDALYQAACLLARGGAPERALDSVARAAAAGAPLAVMARDPDLASVVDTPAFAALWAREAGGPR